MIASPIMFAAALATLSPTNVPSSFGTETEQTFACPSIAERDVWLDFDLDFFPSASNCVEVALGEDVDGDGVLSDSESRFAFAIDCGSLAVRDADGRNLFSYATTANHFALRLQPAKGQLHDGWKLESVDALGARSFLAEGQFVDNDEPLTAWSSARVRISGPDAASAQIAAKRSRHAFVFTVR